jgi:HEAT repeat protein
MRVLAAVVLVSIGSLQPAWSEEPHTFWGKTVEQWLAVYRDKASTEVQRREALYAVAGFGPEAKAALPDLIAALRDKQLVGAAMDGLIGIGGPAVPAIRDVLNDPDDYVRGCAARILAKIGPEARAAVPALIRAIHRPDPTRKPNILFREVVEALGEIGPAAKPAVPALNGLLDNAGDDDFDVVLALNRIGAPPVRKLLDAFLRDANPDTANRLSWLGPKGREAVPALRAALTDKRPEVRVSAAVALAQIEPSAPESVPVLIEALRQPDNPELSAGPEAEALAGLGPRAKTAIPKLIRLIRHGSNESGFLEDLLKVLVQVDPEGTACVPVLIEALNHEELEVVDTSAQCLALLGPRAVDAVPVLATTVTRDFRKEFFNDYDPQVHAAKALRRIGPQARTAIPALIGALKYCRTIPPDPDGLDRGGLDRRVDERNWQTAAAAAQVLGSFGAEAKAAVPALIEAIRTREKDDMNYLVRRKAILALGRIGPDAKTVIPVLRDLRTEPRGMARYRREVVIALLQVAPDGMEIAERWVRESDGVGAEESPAMVLRAMGRPSFEADCWTRHALQWIDWMPGCDDPRDENWIGSLEGWFERIGDLGPAGRLAIPRLNEIRNHHRNPWVRMWAAEALERIEKTAPAKAD